MIRFSETQAGRVGRALLSSYSMQEYDGVRALGRSCFDLEIDLITVNASEYWSTECIIKNQKSSVSTSKSISNSSRREERSHIHALSPEYTDFKVGRAKLSSVSVNSIDLVLLRRSAFTWFWSRKTFV